MFDYDDGSIEFNELKYDYFKGENDQEYLPPDGEHLFLKRQRNIRLQRSTYDTFEKTYIKSKQGNINPLKMHKLALEHVHSIYGNTRHVDHHRL